MICITNRKLCTIPFLDQIELVIQRGTSAIILREKDLQEEEYFTLAESVSALAKAYHTPCICNKFLSVAEKLQLPCQLSFSDFCTYIDPFPVGIGVSVHSLSEAVTAEQLGANWIIAGHIFQTDCKKDLPPRGLPFLQDICNHVEIPVYAIGGITEQNADSVIQAGAKDYCSMSGAMHLK